MQEIRVIDVNQQTLEMFGARSKDHLLNNLSQVFRGEMAESFAEQLQDLWEGKTVQQREVINYSLSGMRCTSTCSSLCWVVIRTIGAWCCSRW